jgi:hypothetical protein
MANDPYVLKGVTPRVEVTDGSRDLPLVLLLHGARGSILDMVDPAAGPDNNYDHLAPLRSEVAIGQSEYPGIGIWSCCELDPTKDVRSWRHVLAENNFATAAYSQVDPSDLLARPIKELVEVVRALGMAHDGLSIPDGDELPGKYEPYGRMVLLAHSRGGLLSRAFLKSFPRDAASITTLITLHSPHTGSSLGTLAVSVTAAIEDLRSVLGQVVLDALGWLNDMAKANVYTELAIDSPFLIDLATDELPLKGIEYFTFGGVSVRLARIRQWVYTLESALPKWRWPPYDHARVETEVPGASPVANSLPNVIEELTEGLGDLLTADSRTRLRFADGTVATHQTNAINHAEALWDPILQAQVLRILGVEIPGGERPDVPSFWG